MNLRLVWASRIISNVLPRITDIFTHREPKSSPNTRLRAVGMKQIARLTPRTRRSRVRVLSAISQQAIHTWRVEIKIADDDYKT
jgi:hypothetical protein